MQIEGAAALCEKALVRYHFFLSSSSVQLKRVSRGFFRFTFVRCQPAFYLSRFCENCYSGLPIVCKSVAPSPRGARRALTVIGRRLGSCSVAARSPRTAPSSTASNAYRSPCSPSPRRSTAPWPPRLKGGGKVAQNRPDLLVFFSVNGSKEGFRVRVGVPHRSDPILGPSSSPRRAFYLSSPPPPCRS